MNGRSRTTLRILFAAGACAVACTAGPVAAETPGVPEIIDLWLVDAATDTRLVRLTDYQTLNLAFVPASLSIEAQADDDTQSVRFTVGGVPGSLENLEPYALGGDSVGDFVPVPALREPGWITITATPYMADGESGAAGPSITRHLYRLRTDFLVDSVADLGDARPGDGKCEAPELRLPLVAAPVRAAAGLSVPGATAPGMGAPGVAAAGVAVPGVAAPGVAAPGLTAAVVTAPGLTAPGLTAPGTTVPVPIDRPGFSIRHVCTLRAAIEEANAQPGRQTISLDGSGGQTYRITRGQLTVSDGLAIYGHERPTIDAERRSRLMGVAGTGDTEILVDLSDLDLANGDAGSLDRGGVLQVEQGTVQIFNSIIRGGEGNFGGGIYLQNGGNALLSGVTVKGNKAGSPESFGGGGVTQRGGGIFNLEGNVTIRNSAIVDNVAVRGGGLSNYGGLVRIENSSILDNEARSLGGGLENRDNGGKKGRMHISFSTITGNRAATSTADPANLRVGGGLYNQGWAFIASSVLAGNSETFGAGNPLTSPDCYSPTVHDFKSYRNVLVGVLNANCLLGDYSSGTASGIAHGTDLSPLSPGLGSRVDAPLPNRVPLAGGPLVDAGGTAGSIYPCPSNDSRGRPRPAGAGCDIGAVERQ